MSKSTLQMNDETMTDEDIPNKFARTLKLSMV